MLRAVLLCSRLKWLINIVAVFSALLTPADEASAANSRQRLDELNHTVFSSLDNAPGDITAIGQSSDGYLWIGSSVGLFIFDGVKFTRPKLKSSIEKINFDISSMFIDANDDIWVGVRLGGIYKYSKGELTRFGSSSGLPQRTVTGIARDADGKYWASSLGGLYSLSGTNWERAKSNEGASALDGAFGSVAVDGRGTVWTAGDQGVFLRPRGTPFFVVGRAGTPPGRVLLDQRHRAWYADQDGLLALTGAERRFTVKDISGYHDWTRQFFIELLDRDGDAWGMLGNSFVRFGHADQRLSDPAKKQLPPPEFLLREQRMSGDLARRVFQDREGNIWVGTSGGLDRFRTTKFSHVSIDGERLPEAALAATTNGTLWIGTDTQGLVRADHEGLARTGVLQGDGPHNGVLSLYAEGNGTVWVGGRSELKRCAGGRVESISLPFGGPAATIQAIAIDSSGALWISALGHGIFRRVNGAWAALGVADGLPALEALSLHGDASGRMWIGYQDNRVLIMEGHSVQSIGTQAGLTLGNTLAMLPETGRMWLAGTNGVGVFENGRYWPLVGKGSASIEGVSGIVRAVNGDLWVNASGGVRRMPANTIAAFLEDHSHPVEWEQFNSQDGVLGVPATLNPLPTAVATSDGRLWFATTSGLFSVDPSKMERNSHPPRAIIDSVVVRGQVFAGGGDVILPRRTSELEVDYTATALTIPERVRFKYRLEPIQAEWQEAVGRRQAYYTNLQPGAYRFSVMAANEDGLWNFSGDAIEIRIPPAFWETWWFEGSSGLAAALLLWCAYFLRLRVIAQRVAARVEDLARERERIARELHDTLLQGTQGLVLNFQGIASTLPKGDQSRQRMEAVLDKAEEILVDARNCVQWLRSSDSAPTDLRAALIDTANELSAAFAMTFELKLTGSPLPVNLDVQDELRRVAAEAVSNAFRHSSGRNVRLELRYDAKSLTITIRDDGKGLDDSTIQAGYRQGHWGLVGMRERAQRIGATIDIKSNGNGTTVSIVVPASRIYANKSKLAWIRTRAFGSVRIRREKNVA